jgi:hypothetical protein
MVSGNSLLRFDQRGFPGIFEWSPGIPNGQLGK